MSRLPNPGADQGVWGDVLNDFLLAERNADGSLKIRTDGTFEPVITAGAVGQYWSGNKTWQTLSKSAVGLGQVDNTSDLNKPISTATQAAVAAKADDSTVVHLSGGTMTGSLHMQNYVVMESQNRIRGYINAVDYVDLYPDFTNGSEKGWFVPQVRLTGGRFDFDALSGKAEIRLHGRPDLNFYDTDNGWYMFQVKTDRSTNIFGNTTVGDDSSSQRWHKVYGRMGATLPDPASMSYQAVDTTNMAAGVGGGIGFVGKYTASGSTAGFASIRAAKHNAVDGDLAGAMVFATRPSSGSVTDRVWIDGDGNVGINQQSPHSRLHTQGSVASAISTKTGSYTLTIDDAIVAADASLGTLQLTLPTAVGIAGRMYTLKKVDSSANAVTVATTASQTIDGAVSASLAVRWRYVTVVSDGANWLITGSG